MIVVWGMFWWCLGAASLPLDTCKVLWLGLSESDERLSECRQYDSLRVLSTTDSMHSGGQGRGHWQTRPEENS